MTTPDPDVPDPDVPDPDPDPGVPQVAVYHDHYPAEVGSQSIDLPIVALSDELAIALLITVDVPLSFIDRAGVELAERLRPHQPEVVVTAATLGIPVAWATARALGHDTIVVLHKTPKTHLADALVEPLSSITTKGEQVFRLDRARAPELAGRSVAFVDDVVSSGGSAAAAMRLIEAAGGRVCAGGALLVEGVEWVETLGPHGATLESLGSIPVFGPAHGGGWPAHGGGWIASVPDPRPPDRAPGRPRSQR